MLKADLILLVRAAQAATDPVLKEELWRRVREAGVPQDATIDEGSEEADARPRD